MAELITIYEPDNSIKNGFRNIFKEMAEEVRIGRWLTWQLFIRDFKAMYKQSFLGILWVFIVPLVTLVTFVLLRSTGKFSPGEIEIPYPVFAILGIAFWQLFAVGIQSTTNSLANAGSMIAKIKFPRETLVFTSMGQAIVSFLIQLVLVAALMINYGIIPSWMIVFVPLTVLPIILFTVGLCFLLSIASGVARDIGRGIGVIMTFMMFITPILYEAPTTGTLATLTRYNPLFYFPTLPRDLILRGEVLYPMEYALSVLLSLLAFVGCWVFFHLSETRITERI